MSTMKSEALMELPEEEEGEEEREGEGEGERERERGEGGRSEGRTTPSWPLPEHLKARYTPVGWDSYFDEECDVVIPESSNSFHVYMAGSEGPVVFCLHGGGYSGLSFALAAGILKEKMRVYAMDMRGHGLSKTNDDKDLSAETLCTDVLDVIRILFEDNPPAIVLVGHSMGGAIAIRVAAKRKLTTLAGLIVVDVVEGTAMSSLIHMHKILSNRPQHFRSVEKAIEWSLKGGSLRNVDSARASVPSTLKFNEQKQCYVWVTSLEESEPYWRGWYEGLSETFLSSPVPKILLLAGTDRLDRALTIGQMQGKFQMVLVRHTGHAIQEDVPEEFSKIVAGFVSRNKIGPHGVEIPGLRRRTH